MEAIILGKKVVGRKETLEYAAQKYRWQNVVIGISAFFGVWAWVIGRLTGRKVIYYCIDFYSPEIAFTLWDKVFIPLAMLMDKFLVEHCDEVWDISERINEGRREFGKYRAKNSRIVPLGYPPDYFRFVPKKGIVGVNKPIMICYVGLNPYGLELLEGIEGIKLIWPGGNKRIPLKQLLDEVSRADIGISLWKHKGNNYYGDPGKTKLYSACRLPVIMTNNTPYAKIIKETNAGLVIPYNKKALINAIETIKKDYNFYKNNVKDTWEYINADELFSNFKVLGS